MQRHGQFLVSHWSLYRTCGGQHERSCQRVCDGFRGRQFHLHRLRYLAAHHQKQGRRSQVWKRAVVHGAIRRDRCHVLA